MLCNYHANRSMGMIFIIFRLVLEVWETGILQTIKIKFNLFKLKYDDMSSAIVAVQFLYSLTVRFSLHNAQIYSVVEFYVRKANEY